MALSHRERERERATQKNTQPRLGKHSPSLDLILSPRAGFM